MKKMAGINGVASEGKAAKMAGMAKMVKKMAKYRKRRSVAWRRKKKWRLYGVAQYRLHK
jgi:hypothetical protein